MVTTTAFFRIWWVSIALSIFALSRCCSGQEVTTSGCWASSSDEVVLDFVIGDNLESRIVEFCTQYQLDDGLCAETRAVTTAFLLEHQKEIGETAMIPVSIAYTKIVEFELLGVPHSVVLSPEEDTGVTAKRFCTLHSLTEADCSMLAQKFSESRDPRWCTHKDFDVLEGLTFSTASNAADQSFFNPSLELLITNPSHDDVLPHDGIPQNISFSIQALHTRYSSDLLLDAVEKHGQILFGLDLGAGQLVPVDAARRLQLSSLRRGHHLLTLTLELDLEPSLAAALGTHAGRLSARGFSRFQVGDAPILSLLPSPTPTPDPATPGSAQPPQPRPLSFLPHPAASVAFAEAYYLLHPGRLPARARALRGLGYWEDAEATLAAHAALMLGDAGSGAGAGDETGAGSSSMGGEGEGGEGGEGWVRDPLSRPCRGPGVGPKFVSFREPLFGLNNQLLEVVGMVGVAKALGRTLLLPSFMAGLDPAAPNTPSSSSSSSSSPSSSSSSSTASSSPQSRLDFGQVIDEDWFRQQLSGLVCVATAAEAQALAQAQALLDESDAAVAAAAAAGGAAAADAGDVSRLEPYRAVNVAHGNGEGLSWYRERFGSSSSSSRSGIFSSSGMGEGRQGQARGRYDGAMHLHFVRPPGLSHYMVDLEGSAGQALVRLVEPALRFAGPVMEAADALTTHLTALAQGQGFMALHLRVERDWIPSPLPSSSQMSTSHSSSSSGQGESGVRGFCANSELQHGRRWGADLTHTLTHSHHLPAAAADAAAAAAGGGGTGLPPPYPAPYPPVPVRKCFSANEIVARVKALPAAAAQRVVFVAVGGDVEQEQEQAATSAEAWAEGGGGGSGHGGCCCGACGCDVPFADATAAGACIHTSGSSRYGGVRAFKFVRRLLMVNFHQRSGQETRSSRPGVVPV